MTYEDFKNTIQELHTGAAMATQIDNISKLVLGKIARLRLKNRVKLGTITVGSNTSWNLNTEFGDFLALKTNPENKNKCIYYYQSTEPLWLTLTNHSRFITNTEGGFATMLGNTLKVDFPTGITNIPTLYVPYYSKFLVLDMDGSTEKEKPENNGDTFLFDSVFDDAFVEGVLLYLKRKELSDYEFVKAVNEWTKSVQELQFYQ